MLQSIIIILSIAAGSWILIGFLPTLTQKISTQMQIAIGAGIGLGIGFLLAYCGLPGLTGSIADVAVMINCVIGFICFRNKTMIGMVVGLLIPVLVRGVN